MLANQLRLGRANVQDWKSRWSNGGRYILKDPMMSDAIRVNRSCHHIVLRCRQKCWQRAFRGRGTRERGIRCSTEVWKRYLRCERSPSAPDGLRGCETRTHSPPRTPHPKECSSIKLSRHYCCQRFILACSSASFFIPYSMS